VRSCFGTLHAGASDAQARDNTRGGASSADRGGAGPGPAAAGGRSVAGGARGAAGLVPALERRSWASRSLRCCTRMPPPWLSPMLGGGDCLGARHFDVLFRLSGLTRQPGRGSESPDTSDTLNVFKPPPSQPMCKMRDAIASCQALCVDLCSP
jgi:hypothetical protein